MTVQNNLRHTDLITSDRVPHFRIQRLTENHFREFRALRLEALLVDSKYFATSYIAEANQSDEQWQTKCNLSDEQCAIGIFNDDEDLIAIGSIEKWKDDASGSSAIMRAAYIQPEYRALSLYAALWNARLEWATQHPNLKTIVVFHRRGNAIENIFHKIGLTRWQTTEMVWADNQTAEAIWYRAEIKDLAQRNVVPFEGALPPRVTAQKTAAG